MVHNEIRNAYTPPATRWVATRTERLFLLSNLEPIDGGEEEYTDW